MSIWNNAIEIALGKKSDSIPIVLQAYSLILKRFANVKEYEYYHNVKLQLEAKIAFQKRFPEVINIGMGTFPEHGEFVGPIPTAFGGELKWMEDAPPYVIEPIKKPEDIDRIVEAGIPEPNAGVASEILKMLEYFYEWFPKDLREEYGYIDGVLCPGACVEGAALAMGYDKFFIWMRLYPDVVHKWLRIATDWYLKYCEAMEEIVGKCKVLWIPDHTPHMVNKEQFNEFVLPYLNKVFGKYKGAFRIWHNEGKVGNKLEDIDKIDAEVWHFGPFDDVTQVRAKTHFCLQGNLHPPYFAKYSIKEVEEECKKLIMNIGIGKFWLSTGGGLAPNTPFKNIDVMVKIAKKYTEMLLRK
ncbi:MAG: uroporphyrinogen decarboxylase family protein [Candidatus Methanomethylicaceae archaeon]